MLGLGVSVLLGHTEVDDVNNVGRFRVGSADKEIVGFYVSVDEVLFVYRLHAGELDTLATSNSSEVRPYHLLGYHDNSLNGESSITVIEQIFQAGTEQVDDQDVVQALLAEIVDIGDTWASNEDLVGSVFVS